VREPVKREKVRPKVALNLTKTGLSTGKQEQIKAAEHSASVMTMSMYVLYAGFQITSFRTNSRAARLMDTLVALWLQVSLVALGPARSDLQHSNAENSTKSNFLSFRQVQFRDAPQGEYQHHDRATVIPSSVKTGTVQQGIKKSKLNHHAIRKVVLYMVKMRRNRNKTDSFAKRMVRM
jgi:hypothetical protein